MHSVKSACTISGNWRGAAQADTAPITAGTTKVRAAASRAGAARPRWRQVVTSSIAAATPARISSSQTVPGTRPVWKIASVSAP